MKDDKKCSWCLSTPLYTKYHDKEWGVPSYKDNHHFEHLILEGAQSGLSWLTILNKRENYRKAFANFDPQLVAKFGDKDRERLMNDAGIVRNKLKINSAIHNAPLFIEIQKEFGSFSNYIWSFVGNKVIDNRPKTFDEVKPITEESEKLAKDLKKRGFKFVGPTTMYAHMQALGLVNDHLIDCPSRK